MPGNVNPGGTLRWPANTEINGTPGTPTALTLTVRDPSGNVLGSPFPISLAGFGNAGVGQYYYDWVVSTSAVQGTYTASWVGTLSGLPISATDTCTVGGAGCGSWVPLQAFALGTIVTPNVSNGRCYYASVGGTTGTTEPTWPGRYPGVVDGTVTWVPYTVVVPQTIRDINGWDSPTGRYSDTAIGNHLLDSIGEIEKTCRRYFVNRPCFTFQVTSNGAPLLPLPGIRTASSVTWQSSVQTAGTPGGGGSGYALLPDVQQTGVYTSIQFRPLRSPDTNGPWYLSLGGATTNWFDTGADNPFDPRNYGGGYNYASVALDTVIVGDWGYAPGSEPNPFVHVLEVLASFAQERPLSLLADSVITPQGGVLSYAAMPAEVRQFISDWSTGRQAVSIG